MYIISIEAPSAMCIDPDWKICFVSNDIAVIAITTSLMI